MRYGLVSQGHEIKQSGVGGNWGCLQTQINKLSALEDKAGAGLRGSFIFFTPESTPSLCVGVRTLRDLTWWGKCREGFADAVALKGFVFKTSSVSVSCLSLLSSNLTICGWLSPVPEQDPRVDSAPQCSALGDQEVTGHGLDSIILELFSRLDDSGAGR